MAGHNKPLWMAPVKKQYKGIAGIALGVLLAMVIVQYQNTETFVGRVISPQKDRYPILAKCSGKEEQELYQVFGIQSPSPDTIDLWSKKYREQVSAIIEEYIQEEEQINCLEDAVTHAPGSASENVKALARKLPPWKDSEDANMLAPVDTGIVLLELLRTYECALAERYFFLFTDTASDVFSVTGDSSNVWWWDVFQEFGKQKRKIEQELAVLRPALHRTLSVANTSGGLQMLRRNVECVKRSSIDIRNGFALGAESAACMPRIQDAKGPFRDLQ